MNLSAFGIVSAFNDCITLFQWAKSAISSLHSRWSSSQEEQSLQDCVLQLESGLQLLRDTLPAMHDLINKAEWRSHEHGVAKLLPNLKDAVSEAEDLLDEFTWYEKKVQAEGDTSQSPFTEFFDTVAPGSFNKQFRGHLEVANVGILSKDDAAEAERKNKKDLDQLTLKVHPRRPQTIQDNELELLQILQPPITLKSLFLQNYAGVSLQTWFQPQNLPGLKSLMVQGCVGFESISYPMITQNVSTNVIPTVGIFLSLTDVTIHRCENISSIEHFLHPDYLPAIKKIKFLYCEMLASATTEKFGDFHFLEELQMVRCPNICAQRLVSPSLKKLSMWGSGLFSHIECFSLTYFHLKCEFVMSIQLQMWCFPALRKLHIECISLTSIGGSANLSISADTSSITTFSSLNVLTVTCCDKLSTLDDLLTQEYLPSIEYIHVESCHELLSLPGERFGSFAYLKDLVVIECRSLNWQRGLVLPSSLQRLRLEWCGDISPYVPSCLQNLTEDCSMPRCPKLKEADQINRRSRPSTRTTS